MPYLEVAVAAPIKNTLTYKSPPESQIEMTPGLRLLVPLGNRVVTGYLLSVIPAPLEEGYSIRAIIDSLDIAPLFPASMVPFFRWLADYYQYPIGEIIKGGLPGGLAPQSGRIINLTQQGEIYFSELASNERPEHPWVEKLIIDKKLPMSSARQIWKTKGRRILEDWADKGLVTISPAVSQDTIKEKKEVCFQLVNDDADTDLLKKSEQKSLQILQKITLKSKLSWVARKDIAREYSGARKALPELAKKGLVLMTKQRVYRDPFDMRPPFYPEPETLTREQQAVLLEINCAIDNDIFCSFLLHGVTGSGKTEVYLQAAARTLAAGKGVLVLVPEIALATQLEGNFLSRFDDLVALLHSGLSAGEKFDQWKRVSSGKARLVIGARSALFAPLSNIGLVIVDEEHDGAYKQEDSFRYQARDAAVMRAKQNQAIVILGSATPSVVSYHNTLSDKYHLLSMAKRVQDRPMPEVEIIDLKSIKTTSGKPPLFSPQLTKAIRENLIAGNQSLIFLNRRGYANLVLCRDCGNTLQCKHCNITLTLHNKTKELTCHYCGYKIKSATLCPHCQSADLVPLGFGTERVEEEIAKIAPHARIGRLDRDTASDRKNYMQILKAVHQRELDILIGTQMITKGHHFPHVTLVGVIWADAGLGIPDYKAGERTFQLLTQVLGRAGRGEKTGRVIVQTHHPTHYSICTAQSHDYTSLFEEEIRLRKTLKYPPFSRLINIRLEGISEANVKKAAYKLAGEAAIYCQRNKELSVLGPAAAPISKLRGAYRWQLMLKGSNLQDLHTLSSRLLRLKSKPGLPGVNLSVDVDPENML